MNETQATDQNNNKNAEAVGAPEGQAVAPAADEKVRVVGIRFRRAGKVYYYDPAGLDLKVNDKVVVSTPRGLKVGWVVIAPEQVIASQLSEPLKPVVRLATPEDLKTTEALTAREPQALRETAELVAKHKLPMKLLAAEYNLEGNYLTIYFKAEDRVDFRELVRDLNSHFKMRVELRQIGPRDEAKILGGYGRCGRPLCCITFLDEFMPVSIRMAKQQNLPLNPMKIAGACGRLLCCLAYEAAPAEKTPEADIPLPMDEEIKELEDNGQVTKGESG